jgi:nucleotidyltransferase/DNA polymerase involved in DNA repair
VTERAERAGDVVGGEGAPLAGPKRVRLVPPWEGVHPTDSKNGPQSDDWPSHSAGSPVLDLIELDRARPISSALSEACDIRTSVRMDQIACIVAPRFPLVAAVGHERVDGEAVALVGGSGTRANIVAASPLAETAGVRSGMSRARALGLCPELRVATPDPLRAEVLWETAMRRLESIGAVVEPGRPGEVYFRPAGLLGLYGGDAATVLRVARRLMPVRVRAGIASSRFGAFAAAVIDRRTIGLGASEERIISDARNLSLLANLPVRALAVGPGLDERVATPFIEKLEMLGIERLGQLGEMERWHLADRFGELGVHARSIARGEDREIDERTAHEDLAVDIEIPDGAGGGLLLERGLDLLIEKLLTQPERKARTFLAVRLSARLVGGGSWTSSQAFGTPTASAPTIASLLRPRLVKLPGPPDLLSLRALAMGPSDGRQMRLPGAGVREGVDRIEQAVLELRELQGPEAVMDIVEVEPESHLPESWAILMPYSAERRAARARAGDLSRGQRA